MTDDDRQAADATRVALARLTNKEKDCLRRRLHHQTAKEIAIDLDISYHAVEKRLKMARTKLGVSSSRDAARMLADAEGYQQTAAQPPDLAEPARARNTWLTAPRLMGVIAISLILAAALVLAVQSGSDPARAIDSSAYEEAVDNPRSIEDLEFVEASPERVQEFVYSLFEKQDKDGSGYIELHEGPQFLKITSVQGGPNAPYDPDNVSEALRGAEAQARYLADADKDGDGRISRDEYAEPVLPTFLDRGIPLLPADWSQGW